MEGFQNVIVFDIQFVQYCLFSNVAQLYVTKYSCNNCVVPENTTPWKVYWFAPPTPPKILI